MLEERERHQLIDRISRIPAIRREVWQGGLVLLPVWVESPSGLPYRPFAAFWVCTSTGRLNLQLETPTGGHGPDLLLSALLRMAREEAKQIGGRAFRLQVKDAGQRDALAEWLHEADILVELVPHLDVLDRAVAEYLRMAADEPMAPALLEGKSVTLSVVRSFAEAAARFYAAAPWQHLSDEDLLEVEEPAPPNGYRCPLVLGNAGHSFGLAFYTSESQYETMATAGSREDLRRHVARSVLFDTPDGIPIADHDLWLEQALPLAGPSAYPFPAHYHPDGHAERPSARELEFATVVLLALADTTEDEMDSGRWKKRVMVDGVEITVSLSLPGLLEEMPPPAAFGIDSSRRAMERVQAEVGRFLAERKFESMEQANAALEEFMARRAEQGPAAPTTPEEQAQWLADMAHDWVGRKRIHLAKRALALWPDCADAYSILGRAQATPEQALPFYEKAVEAGRRAIGDSFEGLQGHLWGHVEARPFMRAKLEVAMVLDRLGREGEAVEQLQELLRLNTGDNQGVRELLVPRLLAQGRLDEAELVLQQYSEDPGATLAYCRALLAFQRAGDDDAARAALAAAVHRNPHVPKLIRNREPLFFDSYTYGSKEEALSAIESMGTAWERTPGAIDWLVQQSRAVRAASRPARKGKKGKRR